MRVTRRYLQNRTNHARYRKHQKALKEMKKPITPTPPTIPRALQKMSNDLTYQDEEELFTREKRLIDREKKLSRDFEERSQTLQEREARLSNQEKEMSAHFSKMKEDFDKERKAALHSIELIQKSVETEKLENIKERERLTKEYQEILESNSAEYIEKTLKTLRDRYAKLDRLATTWQQIGALALLAGLAALIYFSVQMQSFGQQIEWKYIVYISIRGSAFLALLAALSAYASKTGSAKREEAKLTADRIHAIDYGAFYLNTYGKNATWDQINDVFKHWNSAPPQVEDEHDIDSKHSNLDK